MDVRLTYRGKRSDTLEARRLPATRDRSHREFPAIRGVRGVARRGLATEGAPVLLLRL